MTRVKRTIFLHVTPDEFAAILLLGQECSDPASLRWSLEELHEFFLEHDLEPGEVIWNETLWHREFTRIVGAHAANIILENTVAGGYSNIDVVTDRPYILADDRVTEGPSIECG